MARPREHAMPRWRRSAGFSLIEMLVVVAIMAIVAAAVVPQLNLARQRVRGATRQVAAELAYAQRLALTLQNDVRVRVDTATNALQIHEDKNNNGARDAGERVRVVTMEPGVVFSRGNSPATAIIPGSGAAVYLCIGISCGNEVIFRRDGTASADCGLYISSTRGNDTDGHAIAILRASGRAVKYLYTGSAWNQFN